MYTNIDGLSNKVELLTKKIGDNQPHIIMITETKMRPSDESAVYFKAREYTVYRKERSLRGEEG